MTWKAIRSTGGLVEGFVYPKPNLHSDTGGVIEDVNDDDLAAISQNLFGRTYNSTIWSNVLWDVTKNYRTAFEATHRRTGPRTTCPIRIRVR